MVLGVSFYLHLYFCMSKATHIFLCCIVSFWVVVGEGWVGLPITQWVFQKRNKQKNVKSVFPEKNLVSFFPFNEANERSPVTSPSRSECHWIEQERSLGTPKRGVLGPMPESIQDHRLVYLGSDNSLRGVAVLPFIVCY